MSALLSYSMRKVTRGLGRIAALSLNGYPYSIHLYLVFYLDWYWYWYIELTFKYTTESFWLLVLQSRNTRFLD